MLKAIIFAGLFAVPFIPFLVYSSFFFPFITTKAFTFRIIVEIVFAAWVILALIDKGCRPKKSPVLYAVAIFLVITGVANIFSVDSVRSFWSNFERMEGFISLLHLGAFFVVISSVFREVDWKRWWNTSLAASTLMVIYVLLQLAGSVTIHQGGVRVDGTFGNATYLAVYMLIHIFIAALFLYRSYKDVAMRWTYGFLIIGQAIILYNTATRGAILGLLGGLIVVALLNLKNREDRLVRLASLSLFAGLVVLIGGFFLLKDTDFVRESPVLSRFSSITTEELKSGGRSFVWPMAIEGFKERPLLGWGQENFIYVFQENYVPEMYRLEPWFDRAHNAYLDWLVGAGLLGALSYLSLYIITLYLVWRSKNDFSHIERSILTGLLAAYFFHNFFVFDHLVSYILFFSLLSYVHFRNADKPLWTKPIGEFYAQRIALPLIGIFLVLSLYFVNIKPIIGNSFLIEGLKSIQLQEFEKAGTNFKKAYYTSTLGRQEVVQHTSVNSIVIFQSSLSLEKKNEFYAFVKSAVIKEAEDYPVDAKVQLMAGSFLSSTGAFDEALFYLERARELMPGKQQIYFEIANVYINNGNDQAAIDTLQYVGEISPDHRQEMEEYIRRIRNGEI